MERVLILGEGLLPHLADIGAHRIGHHLFQIGVALDEFGREITGHAQQVMHHQNLTVAVRTGPNPQWLEWAAYPLSQQPSPWGRPPKTTAKAPALVTASASSMSRSRAPGWRPDFLPWTL